MRCKYITSQKRNVGICPYLSRIVEKCRELSLFSRVYVLLFGNEDTILKRDIKVLKISFEEKGEFNLQM